MTLKSMAEIERRFPIPALKIIPSQTVCNFRHCPLKFLPLEDIDVVRGPIHQNPIIHCHCLSNIERHIDLASDIYGDSGMTILNGGATPHTAKKRKLDQLRDGPQPEGSEMDN